MKLNIQLDSRSGFLAVRIMNNWKRMLGEKRRGSLPKRKNICEKVHLWSYICTEEWAGWLLWAQLEAFPMMAAQPPTLLSSSPNYDICDASSLGKPNCKSCRKIWFDEVWCWMLDHQQRRRGLRLPWNLQWASAVPHGSEHHQPREGEVGACAVSVLNHPCDLFSGGVCVCADCGRHRQGPSPWWWWWWWWWWWCLQRSVLLSVRSYLLWEELAMTSYRADSICRCLYHKGIDILRLASAP